MGFFWRSKTHKFQHRYWACIVAISTLAGPCLVQADSYEGNSTLTLTTTNPSQLAIKFCHPRPSSACSTFTFAHLSPSDWVSLNESSLVMQSLLQTGQSVSIGHGSLSDIESAGQQAQQKLGPFGKEYLRVAHQVLTRLRQDQNKCYIKLLKNAEELGSPW